MSESVSLKMEEGSSVPLVLRNAGSDGGDVDAVLEVVPYKVIGSQGFVSFACCTVKDRFLGANVESEDGAVLPWMDRRNMFPGSGPSRQEILLDHELPGGGHQRGEWKVAVKYADELKEIMVRYRLGSACSESWKTRNIQQEREWR